MAERIIEAEVVEERIIACLSCRRKNRLHKRSSSGTYKCGACRAELPDPFISTPRKSWRHYGSAAGWTALGAIAVLVIIGLSSRRDFRTTSAGKPSPIQISVPAVIPTPIPAITIPKFTSLAIPTLRPLPSVTPYRLRQAVSTPQSSEFEGTSTPINNQIIFDAYPDSSTRGRLTVSNGTSHHAIAKLIDTTTDAKVLSSPSVRDSKVPFTESPMAHIG
jgi:hypothetical protein